MANIYRQAGQDCDLNDLPQSRRPHCNEEHVWNPPAADIKDYPPGYCLRMEAVLDSAGNRLFLPSKPIDQFILEASAAGLTLLIRRENFDAHRRFSYRVMSLLYQLQPAFREYFDRAYTSHSDLFAAHDLDGHHILPATVGQNAQGQGQSWTPSRLMAEGREFGARNGLVAQAGEQNWIRWGLVCAAERNPYPTPISQPEASAILRMATFNMAPSEVLLEGQANLLEDRFLEMLEKHLSDSKEQFRKWFHENLNNIVHAISKRKRGGCELSREQVRTGLLDLTFRSQIYIGHCIWAQMKAFAEGLSEPLNELEQEKFEAIYRPQLHWGGLPFCLLHPRLDFLREAAYDIWSNPGDPKSTGVILRLLQWYGEMTARRREEDRRKKQLCADQVEYHDEYMSSPRQPRVSESELFNEIGQRLLGQNGYSCRCQTMEYWRFRLDSESNSAKTICLNCECQVCNETYTLEVPRDEFVAAAEELRRSLDGSE